MNTKESPRGRGAADTGEIPPLEGTATVAPKATTEAGWFLQTIFGDAVNDEARIVIWTLPGKSARFFDNCDEAAFYAFECASHKDVYFGVGLYRLGIAHGRGTASDVVCIPALWADIDFGPTHQKSNLPPDEFAAFSIVERIGMRPSIVVHSGHGLHTYWLFKEPVQPEDGAAGLARRWGATTAAHARSLGYTVDSVWDLARVLRIPGTINHKADPVPVRIVEDHTDLYRRYDPSDLDQFMVEAPNTQEPATIKVDDLNLDAKAVFPEKKLATLLEYDVRFRQTWEKRRTDFADDSPSSYDYSLTHFGVMAGLPDQEIANLIITFRRKHGHDVSKCLRGDYIRGRIAKVRALREATLPSGTRVMFKRLPRKAAHQ